MKRLFLLMLLTLSITSGYAQDKADTVLRERFLIEPKINVLPIAFGMGNLALEVGFGEHSAVELSTVFCFKENNFAGTGKPLILNMTLAEYRYYFLNTGHYGFFAGGDCAWDVYKLHKSIIPGYSDNYIDYDWGYGVTLGVTLGYKFRVTEHWFIEASASGGWRLASHEPYNNGEIVVPMNKSGEWLPYKCGVYVSYRF